MDMAFESESSSDIRHYQKLWDEEVKTKKIKDLIDENQFILFFKRGKEVFGAPEESRVIFARMKNPDDDAGWAEEASFSAVNLGRTKSNHQVMGVFSQKDLDDIKVIDKEDAIKQAAK